MIWMLHPHNKGNPTPQLPGKSTLSLLFLLEGNVAESTCPSSLLYFHTRIVTHGNSEDQQTILNPSISAAITFKCCEISTKDVLSHEHRPPPIGGCSPLRLGLMSVWKSRGQQHRVHLSISMQAKTQKKKTAPEAEPR